MVDLQELTDVQTELLESLALSSPEAARLELHVSGTSSQHSVSLRPGLAPPSDEVLYAVRRIFLLHDEGGAPIAGFVCVADRDVSDDSWSMSMEFKYSG